MAIRIPKLFMNEAQMSYGTTVELSVENGRIVIEPQTDPEYRLEDLLGGITKHNLHAEVQTGDAVGREVW